MQKIKGFAKSNTQKEQFQMQTLVMFETPEKIADLYRTI
jgi:hypothetical protein